MSHIKIMTIALSAFIILLGAQMSCSFNSFNYSVMVINQTDEEIRIYPFNLNDSKDSTAAIGEMRPHGRAGYGPFYTAPQKQVIIKWQNIKTKKEDQATVKLELPKEFTKENGLTIYFYLNESSIRPAYKVFDEKIGDTKEVKSPDLE